MTGFGRGRCEVAGRRFVVEARSVNHRFLELKTRLPWSDPLLEQQLLQAVRRRVHRGALNVTVRDEGGGAAAPAVTVDLELARVYAQALTQLAEACALEEPVSLALLASQPGVLTTGAGESGERLWEGLAPGVERALDELLAARAREGAALEEDLRARIATLRGLTEELSQLAAETPAELRRRLEERLHRLLSPAEAAQLDPQRLAQEVALLADRADVTEELTRLRTHLDELQRLLGQREPAGRRLDFLVQELHREVNTIGSKSQRAEIAARIVEAKAEVERLREQIQNVE